MAEDNCQAVIKWQTPHACPHLLHKDENSSMPIHGNKDNDTYSEDYPMDNDPNIYRDVDFPEINPNRTETSNCSQIGDYILSPCGLPLLGAGIGLFLLGICLPLCSMALYSCVCKPLCCPTILRHCDDEVENAAANRCGSVPKKRQSKCRFTSQRKNAGSSHRKMTVAEARAKRLSSPRRACSTSATSVTSCSSTSRGKRPVIAVKAKNILQLPSI